MPSCRQFTHFWRQLLWTGKQNPPTFLRFRMSDMEWYVHKCKSAHSPMLASTAKEAALLRLCSDLDSAQLWVISVQCGGSSLHAAVQCALNWTTLALQCFTTLLTTRSRVQLQCHILPSTDLYNCALVSFHRSGSLHNWLQWLQHCNAIQWMNCRHSATQAKPQQWLLLQILHGDYSICRQICYPIYFKMQKWLNIVL